MEERLIEIESAIAIQEKTIDELNQVVIEQGRQIDRLIKQNLYLAELLKNETVKPQSEETPPPHYSPKPLASAPKRVYIILQQGETAK